MDEHEHKSEDTTNNIPEHKAVHKPKTPTAPKKRYKHYVIGGIIFVIIIAILMKNFYVSSPAVDDPKQYGSVNVTFYVMSQCPYGTQVEDSFAPVLEDLGDNVNFRLEFIVSENPDGSFNSLHGQPEVDGNKIHLCVQEHFTDELLNFVVCQNENPQDFRSSIERCAGKVNIDAQEILDCADGDEGSTLLSDSAKKSQAIGASGSPTIYFGDILYSGMRDTNSFKKEVCKSIEGHPICDGLPACTADLDCNAEPGKVGICENPGTTDAACKYIDDAHVELKIINAKDCTNCDTTQNVNVLKQIFMNLDVEEIDSSTTRGKAFIKNIGLKNAPSYVFSGDIDQTHAWKTNDRLRGAFKKVDKYYVMIDEATGASYILDPAERQRLEKLTKVEKGDNKPQIDFYVMSYCPYGNIAEEAIEPAYRLLKGKADFNPHYVIYSNYQGGGPKFCLDDADKYCSMHGVQELNQGLRELCVHKYMGEGSYFEFVLEMNRECNYNNADSCWEPVAKSLGLDIQKIKDCESNEWEDILSKELELNNALGVRGSPTVFIEGDAYAGSRAPAGYAKALCAGFESKPDECSTEKLAKLGTAQAGPDGSC